MNTLEMRGISKAFSGVTVLDHVDFCVGRGEIHALLGENGAGKSTLMNILTGVLSPDGGAIRFEGKPLARQTVRQTEKLGIAFVHQELNVFNDLKVYENLFLLNERVNRAGALQKKEMRRLARAFLGRLGVAIDADEYARNLKTSEKQLLEISKALMFDARLLILDEPTTALGNEEIDRLFGILRALRAEGRSIIFISHKMPEVFALADKYTVLRNGKTVGQGEIQKTSAEAVARMMVGEHYADGDVYHPRALGDAVLEVKGLTGPGFQNVSLCARKGEIVALTGLKDSGSSEILQAVFGALPASAGEVLVHGRRLRKITIRAAMRARVGMLPANRKENSALPDLSILDNLTASQRALTQSRPAISFQKDKARYRAYRDALNIRAASPQNPIQSLSGGNQQKVFLARWLHTQVDILLLDNPTQGIDVGAKAEFYQLILTLARQGKTILMNTLEIREIQKVADRLCVFYNGEIAAELARGRIDEHTVMLYSTNAIHQPEGKGV